MDINFLTPVGALLAVAAVLPLAAVALLWRRAARLRRSLGLPERPRRWLAVPVLAAAAAATLLGLAAAQPVLERTIPRRVRTDAEVYLVLDVSRSMLAREDLASPSRFARSKSVAARVRAAIPDVRVGLASLTDRVLPHVFPTADEDVFAAALADSIGIERPPPRASFITRATSLDSLAELSTKGFFSPSATRRLAVVLTDGESEQVTGDRLRQAFARPPGIRVVFVQFWNEDEHVYSRDALEPQYRPDPTARRILDALALATRGRVYTEKEAGDAAAESRRLLGSGPTRIEGRGREPVALAPFLALGALLPAGLFLGRREG
jgi:hypothetical protein